MSRINPLTLFRRKSILFYVIIGGIYPEVIQGCRGQSADDEGIEVRAGTGYRRVGTASPNFAFDIEAVFTVGIIVPGQSDSITGEQSGNQVGGSGQRRLGTDFIGES